MLKIPYFCKIRKVVRSKLWPVVTDHLVWYAIEGKVTLQLQNGGAGFGVSQSVHLPEVAIVVYCDQVILSSEGKDIQGNLLPRMGLCGASCCQVPYTFQMRRCTVSFLQTCLASRCIHMHTADMLLFRGGTSECSPSCLRESSEVLRQNFL